jgi:hypothetical protein
MIIFYSETSSLCYEKSNVMIFFSPIRVICIASCASFATLSDVCPAKRGIRVE